MELMRLVEWSSGLGIQFLLKNTEESIEKSEELGELGELSNIKN